jgi:hypothetical protein
VADRGYFKIEDIEACETTGMEPYPVFADSPSESGIF